MYTTTEGEQGLDNLVKIQPFLNLLPNFKDIYTSTQFLPIGNIDNQRVYGDPQRLCIISAVPSQKPYGWGMLLADAHNMYMYIHMKMGKSTLRRSVTMFVIYHGSGKGHQGPSVT